MVETVPNFVSDEECAHLSSWIMENHNRFVPANMGGNRKTTRYLKRGIEFPELAFVVRERVKQYLQLSDAVKPPFLNGMVASYANPGDTCYAHRDPVWYPGHHTLHCNIIVQKPESGGNVVIEGKEYDMPQGDMICYYVSDLRHGVTEVKGNKDRLMWIFAFCVKD